MAAEGPPLGAAGVATAVRPSLTEMAPPDMIIWERENYDNDERRMTEGSRALVLVP